MEDGMEKTRTMSSRSADKVILIVQRTQRHDKVSCDGVHSQMVLHTQKIRMQKFVTVSATEAECADGAECAQDMLHRKQFLEAMELKIALPMTLCMDNKGGVDIFDSWSIAGNTRAISVQFEFTCKLKEAGIQKIKWI